MILAYNQSLLYPLQHPDRQFQPSAKLKVNNKYASTYLDRNIFRTHYRFPHSVQSCRVCNQYLKRNEPETYSKRDQLPNYAQWRLPSVHSKNCLSYQDNQSMPGKKQECGINKYEGMICGNFYSYTWYLSSLQRFSDAISKLDQK